MVLTASTRRNKSNSQQAASLTSSPIVASSTKNKASSSAAALHLNKKALKSLKSKKKKSLRLKNGKESSLSVDKQRSNSIKKAKLLRLKSRKELTKSSNRLREKHLATNGHHRRDINTNQSENGRDEGSNGDDDLDNDAEEQDDEFDQQIDDVQANEVEKFRARFRNELSSEEQKMREELDSILNKTSSHSKRNQSQHQYNQTHPRVTTKEQFKLRAEWYENKLKELRNQIEQLHRLSVLKHEPNDSSDTGVYSSSHIINEYVEEMQRLGRSSNENSLFIEMWHEKQKREIDEQFTREYTKAVQEYQDKQRDLKENLRLEYEEMRRQVDTDRQSLDINTDVSESKPLPTRNLRRRFVQPSNNNQTFDHLMDTSGLLEMSMNQSAISLSGGVTVSTMSTGLTTTGASCSLANHNTSISATSIHLYHQSTALANVNSITNTSSNTNIACSIGNSILGTSHMMTLSAQQAAIERKRKLNPALITFTLSEDELNDDLKYLFKNVNSTNKEKLFQQSFQQLMNATN
jgi:hypothetical protein